jgi:hypothetical protein
MSWLPLAPQHRRNIEAGTDRRDCDVAGSELALEDVSIGLGAVIGEASNGEGDEGDGEDQDRLGADGASHYGHRILN